MQKNNHYDLVIIGAGINGAGIARDAALRGLSVLVVEQSDICSATSAWNSRLVHGGLRYLEHKELGLVRESLRERENLLRSASHLVHPLPLMIPIYASNRRGHTIVRMGMMAYDLLSYDKSLPRHRMLSRQQAAQNAAGLDQKQLKGAAQYYDAQVTFPERLTLEVLLCARENGAEILTHTPVKRINLDESGSAVSGVRILNRATGEEEDIVSKCVVNVSGPWVDQVLTTSGHTLPRQIGGTRGSHIVVAPFSGAPQVALYAEAEDGRPYFTIPWNGLFLIGTTDLHHEEPPDSVHATEEEIDYLLNSTNRLLPSAQLERDSVLYSYAGVRPLPYVPAGQPGTITRRHIVHDHSPQITGLWSIIGGKLTTYRSLAEEAVNKVAAAQGWRLARCSTHHRPLPGARRHNARELEKRLCANYGLTSLAARRIVSIYGARSEDILELLSEAPELAENLSPETGAIKAELVFAMRYEMAANLTDALMRRTMVGLGPAAGLDALENAVATLCQHLNWDRHTAMGQADEFRQYVAHTLRTQDP
ncbi:glycerol-3-phosphate dehydrogenase [Halorhodospira halochloris]|uniref:glycerol-3-phosphate dehydrogenase n=1 Tax=Halorhodospira halochloris TaxID=1052 RepID=UPI001EE7CCF7|nr:glycerol-3-phosphate dehydrogenase [Halorhodospira halochloris]MCG5530029.1 glycerol-3-phosphate dehydrogenase [Halorhodospira halochloris]